MSITPAYTALLFHGFTHGVDRWVMLWMMVWQRLKWQQEFFQEGSIPSWVV
jgi:hypothetical protein